MSGKVITVLSTKGGVGKSTLTRFLSIVANEHNKKVCIIDTCQNSSIATGFLKDRDSFNKTAYDWLTGDAKPSEVIQRYKDTNIYYIPSDERIDDFEDWVSKKVPKLRQLEVIKVKVKPLLAMFDYVIIDTHPNENSDIVNYSIAASDFCLIPSEVDLDSKLAAIRCVEIIEDYRSAGYDVDYGIAFNKVEFTKGKASTQMRAMKDEMIQKGVGADKFLGDIRYSTTVSTSKNEGLLLSELENKYTKNIMEDFRIVANNAFKRMESEVTA